ncbi:hypothetical protein [uncultured Muriicola sp.]|uniref:hypothetical protein n=1 Tax=uncultured Muriicola sp. TaxID=1583102 RepID=UPI0026160174|nr:hypothetical protein [uncultured Muriicola sp.]
MKNWKLSGLMLTLIMIFATSCEKSTEINEQGTSPELPPFESMAFDFEAFEDNGNSGKSTTLVYDNKAPNGNWVFSRIVVGVWSSALYTTLAVPVASFQAAFSQTPEKISDDTWEWTYSVDGFASQYTARLTGQLSANGVAWNMYITKMGPDNFEDFLWFSGNSSLDGNSGSWILNQGPDRPDPMLQINWERSGDEIGFIRYTWVRALDDQQNADPFRNSYLEYGLQDGDFDAYFYSNVYDSNLQEFTEVDIEWSRDTYEGRVRAAAYFEDILWHCWDSTGEDIACE